MRKGFDLHISVKNTKLERSNEITHCSKSIKALVPKNTFIHIEQIYSSSPIGNAHTYPSGPAIVGNTPGTLEWCSAGLSRST
jgi:hypothetical protein